MAWPMPIHTEPCTWPSTVRRLRPVPLSSAAPPLSPFTTPESSPTLTFTPSSAEMEPPVAREVEAEHLGHGLHQDGRRSLPDVGGAREHDDGAVEIELDLDGGVRLAGPVHGLGRAADVMRAG